MALHQTVGPEAYEVILADVSQGADYAGAIADAEARKDPRLAFTFLDLGKTHRAVGYNRALEASRGDLIVFFGDDYLAPHELVEAHLAFHERHPEEHAVGIGSAILTGPQRANRFAVWLEESGEIRRADARGRHEGRVRARREGRAPPRPDARRALPREGAGRRERGRVDRLNRSFRYAKGARWLKLDYRRRLRRAPGRQTSVSAIPRPTRADSPRKVPAASGR